MAPLGQGLIGRPLFRLCSRFSRLGQGFPFQEVNPQRFRQPLGFGGGSWGSGFICHSCTDDKASMICQARGLRKAKACGMCPLILVRCCSSVVEHSIGNGEVDSSILSSSTIFSPARPAHPDPREPGAAANGSLPASQMFRPKSPVWPFLLQPQHAHRKDYAGSRQQPSQAEPFPR